MMVSGDIRTKMTAIEEERIVNIVWPRRDILLG
jgi:hypothetical protein